MKKLAVHLKATILMSWLGLMVFFWVKLALFVDTFADGYGVGVMFAPFIIAVYVVLCFSMKNHKKKD
jgi:hypothetical protein